MIRLAKPFFPAQSFANVCAVLKSGHLIQGAYVKQFEEALRRYLGVKHAFLVSSGTAALHLSLLSLGIRAGDEVIVPAFTFPATANVVELVGARAVPVDIRLDDFCIDSSKIEKAITSRTKAIMPVHEFGQSAEMKIIMEIARSRGVAVVEDAACALGTEYDGKKAGTLGKVGCFSFHPRKAITTGEGGAVVTEDDGIAEKIAILRNHGICAAEKGIDFIHAGFNYRMTDIQAAIGVPQLMGLDRTIERRIRIASYYHEAFEGLSVVSRPATFGNRRMVYQSYHILLNDGVDRQGVIASMKKAGIETNLGAYALQCLSYYRNKYGFKEEDFPNALKAYRQGLALPVGHHVKKADVAFIARSLRSLLEPGA
jgi:perosamine synthetase